jgi:formylglycine-generating enzyme required for sulfatase activity/tRNA A-37 threonylcarbamoyl transferase component Bud32
MIDLVGQYLGRYYLTERLGEGGMATVYRGYDTRLERDVAVKVIRKGAFPPDTLEHVLGRFEREAKSLAKLSHPSIVKVYDYGEHDGSPYLVMEYLPGGTLKELIGKPLPWPDALRLLLPVARGVAYAHRRGILHRDIKPANILITDDGEPMLSDFGIAKLFEADETPGSTTPGTVIGTPGYMAPEQWSGKAMPKSDLYSLGIVLYEMVTGRKPYEATTPGAIAIKQATEPLPSPRKFAPDLPKGLEQALVKALAREPGDRHQDTSALIGELENLQAGAAAREKARLEAEERARRESEALALKLAAERARKEQEAKARLEAEERARREKEEREDRAAQSAAQERARRAVAEQARREKIARDSVEKAAREQAKREATEKIRREKVERRATRRAALTTTLSKSLSTLGSALSRARPYVGIAGIVGLILVLVWLGSSAMAKLDLFAPAAIPSATPDLATEPLPMNSPAPPTKTLVRTTTPTQTLTPTPTSLLTDITDAQGVAMRLVPASDFTMGSETGDDVERPVRRVYLDAFYMDKYEVTNALYKACVTAGVCDTPGETTSYTRPAYYGNSGFDNYPVIYVDWNQAETYCEWRGAELPTEAQWEKAARSANERTYPWGEGIDETFANYSSNVGDTTAVGSYETGKSPYGLYDMAGNVWEWVADRYSETDSQAAPAPNPLGSDTGQYRVLRGGSWHDFGNVVRSSFRVGYEPSGGFNDVGFRCSRSPSIRLSPTATPTQLAQSGTPTAAVSNPSAGGSDYLDAKGVPMRLVPAGELKMGSDNGNSDERPVHEVYLDAFYMDKNEVTNAHYKACVEGGACEPPKHSSSSTRSAYYGSLGYEDYPVIFVDWSQAKSYCEWRGAGLPTEAQWEKAARGMDERTWPWGEGVNMDCSEANFVGCLGDTTAVGSYEGGVSPYGLYDMAGNVWEWVADWYSETYYESSPASNPKGPDTGGIRVQRGGSWLSNVSSLRGSRRSGYEPEYFSHVIGFRCARDASP